MGGDDAGAETGLAGHAVGQMTLLPLAADVSGGGRRDPVANHSASGRLNLQTLC